MKIMPQTMILLPKTKSVDGMLLTLISRVGEFALVSTKTYEGGYESGYEVHRIRLQDASDGKINGKAIRYKSGEFYRTAREFGFHAWAYPTLEAVYADFPQFNLRSKDI